MDELGIRGWDWEHMAPYYRRFHTPQVHDDHRNCNGTSEPAPSGPIKTSLPTVADPLHQAWVNSLRNLGQNLTGAPLSGDSIGAYSLPCAVAPVSRERSHAGKAYIEMALQRPNFHLMTSTHVERILFHDKLQTASGLTSHDPDIHSMDKRNPDVRATGVLVSHQGKSCVIKAHTEVILCAGAFTSPQLLELSGVGKTDICERNGIDLIVENPNVGGTST